jgi:glycosyltransferase involved in cell wall biosynthesis
MKIKKDHQPLVSVITPVYNGEGYLADCIESVLAQTYENWVYIIVNNRSTDDTPEIIERYTQRDSRIRVHNNADFLSLMQNWNHAIQQITPESKYCKVIHADDLLFPTCIERMVELAEANSNVGIVGSYSLLGNTTSTEVTCSGITFPNDVASGREINRAVFRGDFFVFGSPTVSMIRADLIRSSKKFYNDRILYADNDACFRLLQDCDFGFVHQALSYVRLHEESQSSTVGVKLNQASLEFIGMLKKYGPTLFTDKEYDKVLKMRFRRYYRFLAKNLLLGRGSEFWQYHKDKLMELGHPLSTLRLIGGAFSEAFHMLVNMGETLERVRRFANKRRRTS